MCSRLTDKYLGMKPRNCSSLTCPLSSTQKSHCLRFRPSHHKCVRERFAQTIKLISASAPRRTDSMLLSVNLGSTLFSNGLTLDQPALCSEVICRLYLAANADCCISVTQGRTNREVKQIVTHIHFLLKGGAGLESCVGVWWGSSWFHCFS